MYTMYILTIEPAVCYETTRNNGLTGVFIILCVSVVQRTMYII